MDVNGSFSKQDLDEYRARHGGLEPEQFINSAETETAEKMLGIARRTGFASVQQVLEHFDSRMDDAGFAGFDKRLNSATPDALVAFRELIDRIEAHGEAVEHENAESADGFSTFDEVREATDRAFPARSMGTPDHALELRISSTHDDVIQDRVG